jgi:hypothetical protein
VRRAALTLLLVTATVAGCGGAETGPASEPAATAKTPQQIAAEKLVAEYEATPGCSSRTRARASSQRLGSAHQLVSTSQPSAVTQTVCSNCALRLPSRVTAVQPSASRRARPEPSAIIGSMVKTIPGSSAVCARGS